MSNYTKATNFAVKDGLVTTDPAKIIKGLDIDNEFNAISNAIASKTDVTSPSLLGTPTAPTATTGTNTTQIATTAFVTAATVAERTATATLTNKTLTSPAINTPTIAGGSITGITDLTVADGGTGVSTIPANAVVLGNGTSAIQTVAPSTSGNILTSNGTTWTSAAPVAVSGLGLNGETWQSPTRVKNTTYTNSLSYPIMVSVYMTGNGANSNGVLTVAGTTVAQCQGDTTNGASSSTMTAIVPPGATYSVSGSRNVSAWVELR